MDERSFKWHDTNFFRSYLHELIDNMAGGPGFHASAQVIKINKWNLIEKVIIYADCQSVSPTRPRLVGTKFIPSQTRSTA